MSIFKKLAFLYIVLSIVFLFADTELVPFALIMAMISALHADVDKLRERLK